MNLKNKYLGCTLYFSLPNFMIHWLQKLIRLVDLKSVKLVDLDSAILEIDSRVHFFKKEF